MQSTYRKTLDHRVGRWNDDERELTALNDVAANGGARERVTVLPCYRLTRLEIPQSFRAGSYKLMLSTRKHRSLLFSVLILLDFASRIPLVEYLQRRVARVTPHSRRPSPMMTPMAAKTTGEKKDDGENDNHA